MLALGIGADDAERAARGDALVPGAGGKQDHVAGLRRQGDSGIAAELHRDLAAVHAERFVARAVEVVEGNTPLRHAAGHRFFSKSSSKASGLTSVTALG